MSLSEGHFRYLFSDISLYHEYPFLKKVISSVAQLPLLPGIRLDPFFMLTALFFHSEMPVGNVGKGTTPSEK